MENETCDLFKDFEGNKVVAKKTVKLLLEFVKTGFSDQCVEYCQDHGLLASQYVCPACGKNMKLVNRKAVGDGVEWECRYRGKDNPHRVCRSVRCGTWFAASNLSIPRILLITFFWYMNLKKHKAAKLSKVSRPSVMLWYMSCREVCLSRRWHCCIRPYKEQTFSDFLKHVSEIYEPSSSG